MEKLIKHVLPLLIFTALLIYAGFVLSHLWRWFVVPLGVHSISTAWGIGLITVFSIFKSYTFPSEEVSPYEKLFLEFIMVNFAFLIGYFTSFYM